MDTNLLKLFLIELKKFPFIYDKKIMTYQNVKGRQHYVDAFTLIATEIIIKEKKYFYIQRKYKNKLLLLKYINCSFYASIPIIINII